MKRKFLSLLLALAMACSLFVPAMAADEEGVAPYAVPADVNGKLVVIHTNDTHGHDVAEEGKTLGTAGVAALKKEFEAAGASVLLVSAGDFSQGTTLVSLDKGASAVDFMNAAGYDAATLGNHEFDYKMEALEANVARAEFPILAANIVYTESGEALTGDRVTFDTAIGKVGVFGLDTPETMTKAHPDNVKGLTFYQGDELVQCAQAQVDALKEEGCAYIIALTHLGVADESEPNRSTDVFAKVTGVDLVVDGHSHTVIDGGQAVGGALVVSTGEYLNNVGVVITDGASTTARLVSAAEYTKVDADVNAVINAKNDEVAAEMAKSFGKTEVTLNGERAPGNRTEETNLGDFAADALLWQARQNLGEDAVDAALTNGGGIRATINAGDITMNDMKTVFPFGNTVVTIDVTGAQLLEALEAATCTTPDAIGAFPQVSGMEFTIDNSVAYENGEKYTDSTYYAPANPGSRVTIATVGGEAWDANATYTIATNDFTAAGGDTYYVFKAAKNVTMTAVAMEDALINYTREVLGGVISAGQYGEPAGRITVKYPGLLAGKWYSDAAKYVMDNGLMGSAGQNGFWPEGTVTRATVLQILFNMEGAPEAGTAFPDAAGTWFADAADWAAEAGIVEAGGVFIEGDLSRAELAQLIANYAAYKSITVDTSGMAMKEASDYDAIPSQYLEGMAFCYYAGLMTGDQSGRLNPENTLTRAELAQMLLRFAELQTGASTPVPAPEGDGAAAAEGKYTEETVAIQVHMQQNVPAHVIPAIVTLPEGASADAKVPGVVMLHGTGSDKHEAGGGYDVAAPQLAAMGIASIRIDFMGCGDSKADYSDYSFTSANIDAKAAADYLAGLEAVDGGKLAVMGWSQGGTNALLAAAKHPDTFKAVVTWSGALDLKGMFEHFNASYDAARKSGFVEMTFDWREPLHVGKQWFTDVKNTDILAEVAKIEAPVLAINGDQDVVVPVSDAQSIAKAAKDGAAWIEDGADHTYNMFSGNFTAINSVVAQTGAFLESKLSGTISASVTAVEKYGNIDLDVAPQTLLDAGFEYGDILSVTAGGQTLSIPFGTAYSDVDTGSLVVRHSVEGDMIIIAVNMGDFSKTYGVKEGDAVTIAMGEKAGYKAEYEAHQVTRTNERADYASDEVFANFRPIVMGDIAEGVLYRTSSPVNPELGRAAFADNLIEQAGVMTVVNMADAKEDIDGYIAAEGFDSPYYQGLYEAGNVIALNMGVDFTGSEFQSKLKNGLEFMLAHEGPYAFHCTEGKDRAGFMAILLEALMGAGRDEIVADYMRSYENYYHVEKGSDQYKTISNIADGILCQIAGLDKGSDLSGVDLVKAASDYLTGIGMTADQIASLQTVLSTPIAAEKAA